MVNKYFLFTTHLQNKLKNIVIKTMSAAGIFEKFSISPQSFRSTTHSLYISERRCVGQMDFVFKYWSF